GAGDQHVLADHVELQRAVRGVAVGIEERGQLRRHLVRDRPQVAGRHHDVLGEGAVAVDPDPDRVRAQVRAPAAAVAAVAADDVALGGHALADAVAVHARADLGDAADELVPDHQPGPDGALAPLVPQVDVQVGAADRGLLDLDQHFVGARGGHRHVLHPDALSGLALDQRPHRPGHRPPALGKAPDYTRRAPVSRRQRPGPGPPGAAILEGIFPTLETPMRHMVKILAVALAGAIGTVAAGAAQAGEGMWVPQQLPEIAGPLKQAGLELPPEQLADLTGQPMGAVVSLGGCTASFVSPQGLVVTNHHCAYGGLQLNSTPDNNLIA